MNIFELFGTITVDTKAANEALDATIKKAQTLNEELGKSGSGGGGTGSGGGNSGGSNSNSGNGGNNKSFVVPTGKTNASSVFWGNLATDAARNLEQTVKKAWETGQEYARSKEFYTTAIGALANDKAKAEWLVSYAEQLAADTPLKPNKTLESSMYLLRAGMPIEQIPGMIETMGNITMGDSEKTGRFAYALMQTMTKGKYAATEGKQLSELGFNIEEYLAEYLKVDGTEIDKMQKEGQISSDDAIAAIMLAASPGHMYHNTLRATMDTTTMKQEKKDELQAKAISGLAAKVDEYITNPLTDKKIEAYEALDEALKTGGGVIDKGLKFVGENIADGDAFPVLAGVGSALLKTKNPYLGMLGMALSGTWYGSHKVANANIEKRQKAIEDEDIESVLEMDRKLFAISDIIVKGTEILEKTVGYKDAIDGVLSSKPWNEQIPDGVERPSLEKYINGSKETQKNGSKETQKPSLKKAIEIYNQALTLPDADASTDEIEKWFETLDPELKKKIGIEFPDSATSTLEVLAWWEEVRPKLVAYYYAEPGGVDPYAADTITGGFATGLDFVPRDNFIARLHKGEAVLTAKENSEYRQMRNGGDVGAAIAQLTDAINELQEGFQTNMNLYVNKKHVASALSRDMGRSIGNREYTLVRGMGG